MSEIAQINPRQFSIEPDDDSALSFAPMKAVEEESGRLDPSETRRWREVKKGYTRFEEGDVLFAKITPCMENGKCAIALNLIGGRGAGSTEFHVVRPDPSCLESRYLLFFLLQKRVRRDARLRMKGAAGQLRVPVDFIEDLQLPRPPLSEQRRIVARIEELFIRLDAAVAALERVRVNLKRYRASVLQAACEGRLVPTEHELATAEGREYESASDLLERILTERRERWEAEQLAKLEARGKPPKDDRWKAKYKEPSAPATDELPGLPEGWVWSAVGQPLVSIEAGKNFRCIEKPPRDSEAGVVKVSAVSWGEFNELESKTVPDSREFDSAKQICPGDFLFSRANTIELVGACVIVRSVCKRLMLSDKILRLASIGIPSHWLLYYFRSSLGRHQIESRSTGNQASMRNISQKNLRLIPIPLPPLAEQHRIVAEVDRRLSVVQRVEAEVEANLARAGRLRQAILKRAFEGRLVETASITGTLSNRSQAGTSMPDSSDKV